MKFIAKTIEDNRTGAVADFHLITGLNVDYANKVTHVSVAAYVSKAKKEAGKDALSVNTFTIQAAPDWMLHPYEWVLAELIKPQPEDFVPDNYYGYVNPYLYSGGKIKREDSED